MMMTNRIEVGEHFCRYRCANGREFLFDKCDLTFFQDKICTVDERGYVTTHRKKIWYLIYCSMWETRL